MSTTAGSWAFVGARSARNSAIAQTLLDAGLIILGKTNMTVSPRTHAADLLPKLIWLGVRRNEDDDDDAWVVRLWWADDFALRRRD